MTMTYRELNALIEPLAAEAESIARRLRMGAIAPELAAVRLRTLADKVEKVYE